MVDVVPGTKNKAIREVVDGLEYFTPVVSTDAPPAGNDVATDPAAAGATDNSLLRGILSELQAQTVLLQTIATNTTPTP